MEQNQIGRRLMALESIRLEGANQTCDMCVWLERGYQTADEPNEIEAYGTEILLHRRSFHISSPDNVN